ncbi:MAG TPA: helix-turn-helix domain-containing protein [Streptosporangiaceae bacterium]
MESGERQGLRRRPYRMRARAQAAEATAATIIAAARALFAERAYDQVSLPAIAERAGVTVQTVLRRFGSKDGLFAAAARERSDQIRADREAAPAGDVSRLVAHYERWGDEQAHLLAQEARVPAIRAITDAGRRYHRDWITRAYGPRLKTLPTATRRRRLAQLAVITDLAVWRLLRRELGLGPDQTAAAISELVDACLSPDRATAGTQEQHR